LFDRLLKSGLLSLLLCVVYGLTMGVVAPGFASFENLTNVLVAMLPLMVVATGQTVVLITAGIDLSVTSIIAVTSIAGAALVTGDDGRLIGFPQSEVWATPVAIIAMLAIGALVGLLNGGCVVWLKMPPFIVTLTVMMFVSGLAIWSTQSQSISDLPHSLLVFGKNAWLAGGIALTVGVGVQFLLSRSRMGSGLRAIGYNSQTALAAGVDVNRLVMLAYVVSGLCAAIASLLIIGQLETGSPVQWENNLLDVIGATVIGGTSLYGGRGHVVWTFFGVLLLTLIDNSLNLLNLSYFTIMMAKGGVILLAALLDTLRTRAEAR
jgi:ribose/xylose/arabinose/galactoside ABC-type transport system permease subunit